MMRIASKRTQFTIALLCGLLSVPAVATTGIWTEESKNNAITVPLADLNLSNKVGVVKLYQRLKAAARQVCGSQDYRISGMQQSRLNKQCYLQALSSAVNEIDSDLLREIHTS